MKILYQIAERHCSRCAHINLVNGLLLVFFSFSSPSPFSLHSEFTLFFCILENHNKNRTDYLNSIRKKVPRITQTDDNDDEMKRRGKREYGPEFTKKRKKIQKKGGTR